MSKLESNSLSPESEDPNTISFIPALGSTSCAAATVIALLNTLGDICVRSRHHFLYFATSSFLEDYLKAHNRSNPGPEYVFNTGRSTLIFDSVKVTSYELATDNLIMKEHDHFMVLTTFCLQ
jgi:hypothetical protein